MADTDFFEKMCNPVVFIAKEIPNTCLYAREIEELQKQKIVAKREKKSGC